MPHIRIEYSSNIEEHHDIQQFVDAIHQAAIDTGIFPLAGIRTRTEPRDVYAVADRQPNHAFLAIEVRIGPGRTDEELQTLLHSVIDTASAQLSLDDSPLAVALSTEVTLIDASLRINRNGVAAALDENA